MAACARVSGAVVEGLEPCAVAPRPGPGPSGLRPGLPDLLAKAPGTIYQRLPDFMAANELIDFRRAFLWLLCGMLLPSVALVAFGVVAVANERAAVERRLENEYGSRLGILKDDLDARLQAAAISAASAIDSGSSSGLR